MDFGKCCLKKKKVFGWFLGNADVSCRFWVVWCFLGGLVFCFFGSLSAVLVGCVCVFV